MKHVLTALVLLCSASLYAQDTLTIMYWNVLNFPTSGAINRQDSMQPVFEYLHPDVLLVNELTASSGADAILSALNSFGAADYQRAVYVPNQSSTNNLQNMCFYRSSKLSLQSQDEVLNDLRDINEYKLRYTESGTGDIVDFDCYVAHLKAGNSSSDEARRKLATDAFKAHLDASGEERLRIFGGDMNVYTSSDDSYQAVLTGGLYDFEDPISTPGSWSNNSSFASVHTQSTRTASFGGGSTGGMDDRFDQILLSSNIMAGGDLLSYISGSYDNPGNDGAHFNQSIITGTNTSAPAEIIDALYQSTDHLPVLLKVLVDPTPDTTTVDPPVTGDACSNLFFSEYIEGSSNNKAFEIYNPTDAPITLTGYSVSAYNNGATSPTNTLALSGTLAAGGTYLIANSSADPAILGIADVTSAVTFINGDDAIVLFDGTTIIDVIGEIGVDPGTNWPVGSGATSEFTLVRSVSVQSGTDDWSIGDDQWDVYPQNTFSFFGNHTINPCESAVCDAATAPTGLTSSISAAGVTLTWDDLPGAEKCEVNGRPTGASSFAKIRVDVPPYEAFVPAGALTAGTTYEWKLRCACTLSPLVVTPFSAGLETFVWPAPRNEGNAEINSDIFPNPATKSVTIQIPASLNERLTNSALLILNASGQVVFELDQVQNQVTLSITDWPEGIYFVKIESADYQTIGKLTVIH